MSNASCIAVPKNKKNVLRETTLKIILIAMKEATAIWKTIETAN